MTLARLLTAALAICSLPVFAQDQQSQITRPSTPPCGESSLTGCPVVGNVLRSEGGVFFFDLNGATAATPEEPSKIISNQPSDASSGKDPLNRLQIDKYKVFRSKTNTRTLLLGPEADAGMVLSGLGGDLDGVTTCLKIRSYVVARDSKDSDSTHPVGYSTCQPSTRYRVRTTEMRAEPVAR
jgi:hypothetical protein